MSKDSEKRMRMTSKSSHSLVQRIHHALKRKDPVPASREAHGNGAIPQFSNVETEISMSLAVFVVTETMGFLHFFGAMLAIFCVFPHHFAETSARFFFCRERWRRMKPCSVPYKPSKRSRFVTAIYNTNLGWMTMAIRFGRGSAS